MHAYLLSVKYAVHVSFFLWAMKVNCGRTRIVNNEDDNEDELEGEDEDDNEDDDEGEGED